MLHLTQTRGKWRILTCYIYYYIYRASHKLCHPKMSGASLAIMQHHVLWGEGGGERERYIVSSTRGIKFTCTLDLLCKQWQRMEEYVVATRTYWEPCRFPKQYMNWQGPYPSPTLLHIFMNNFFQHNAVFTYWVLDLSSTLITLSFAAIIQ